MRVFIFVLLLSFGVVFLSQAKDNIFAPPSIVVKKPERESEIVVSNNPLQWYKLNAYKLTGIIVSKGLKMAMVVSPDHRTYIVKPGDFLGNRGERIVDITEYAVVLEWRGKRILKPISKKEEE